MEDHKVPDHILTTHELSFRDLYKGVNDLRKESGQYMTTKAGITFFLGTLVTLAATFMGQSYMQNQTYLEIRKQDVASLTSYQLKTDVLVNQLSSGQVLLESKVVTVERLQDEIRQKLKLKE